MDYDLSNSYCLSGVMTEEEKANARERKVNPGLTGARSWDSERWTKERLAYDSAIVTVNCSCGKEVFIRRNQLYYGGYCSSECESEVYYQEPPEETIYGDLTDEYSNIRTR